MTDQHLDLDALADVLVGEAPSAVSLHARTCSVCAADLAALAAAQAPVAAALAAAPEPALPAGLDARLAAAVAHARADPPGARSVTVVPLAARRRRWQPWAGGLAAAAVLGTAGVLVVRAGAPSGSTTASTGGPATQDRAAAAGAVPTSSTGTDYRAGSSALATALPALLRGGAPVRGEAVGSLGPSPVSPQPGPSARSGLDRLRAPAALAACLSALQDPASTTGPLALDYATYRGAPALVVLLPSTRPGKVDAYVVGAGCSQADAQVLFFGRLPAP